MAKTKTKASAYVLQNTLCVLGVCCTQDGPIPFSVAIPVEAPDGPVDFGNDTLREPLQQAKAEVGQQISDKLLERTVADLVERARLGDQNALAILIQTRARAEAGNKRARRAAKAVKRFISKHAPGESVYFGTETALVAVSPEDWLAKAKHHAALAPVSQAVIFLADGRFGAELIPEDPVEKEAFVQGLTGPLIPNVKDEVSAAYRLGGLVRLTRLLKAVRAGRAFFSKAAAWELG
jgi:hypothetical protein